MTQCVRIGIIGGGLMGREVASALSRWFVLDHYPTRAELVAVCDVAEPQRDWFRQVPGVQLVTADHQVLLESSDVDMVYVALPHHLHEAIYLDVLQPARTCSRRSRLALTCARRGRCTRQPGARAGSCAAV